MSRSGRMLRLADILFVIFHSLLIVFNLFGWMVARVRRIHLVCISATIISWVGLGFWFGFGYCPLTDWHWDVKRALGDGPLPASWVKYYVDSITGVDWDPAIIDAVVGFAGMFAFVASIVTNWHDIKHRRS